MQSKYVSQLKINDQFLISFANDGENTTRNKKFITNMNREYLLKKQSENFITITYKIIFIIVYAVTVKTLEDHQLWSVICVSDS